MKMIHSSNFYSLGLYNFIKSYVLEVSVDDYFNDPRMDYYLNDFVARYMFVHDVLALQGKLIGFPKVV